MRPLFAFDPRRYASSDPSDPNNMTKVRRQKRQCAFILVRRMLRRPSAIRPSQPLVHFGQKERQTIESYDPHLYRDQVILIVTSAAELKGHKTGLWIEELAAPYYEFKKAGYEVEIASPEGGAVPIDAASLGEGFFTEPAKKFMVSRPPRILVP